MEQAIEASYHPASHFHAITSTVIPILAIGMTPNDPIVQLYHTIVCDDQEMEHSHAIRARHTSNNGKSTAEYRLSHCAFQQHVIPKVKQITIRTKTGIYGLMAPDTTTQAAYRLIQPVTNDERAR